MRSRVGILALVVLGATPGASLGQTGPAAGGAAPVTHARRLALAPKLGVAWSPGGMRPLTVAAEATWQTALADGRVGLALEVGSYAHHRTDSVLLSGRAVEISGDAQYVPILLSVAWRDGTEGWPMWGTVGGGAAHVEGDVTVAGSDAPPEAGWVPVVHASMAWGLRLGDATPFAEVRVAWHGDPGFASLGGSLTTVGLALGFRYDAL
ncbi:hypothetical protein [Anaeromyxobacter oryzae]|uniref:Outer membrane protein beta-barrel domain-containing protein n=1 Tax=Anaeromyxobacter oryzae TaxID=2918170 RepID=A0ABN6MX92_9BACT|nr:hypothetical protein [Anaeromyxobacter oryzae]BDG05525.1 hypothetical protein AMOR_45210 [Anaeromyxobacter oryzae]